MPCWVPECTLEVQELIDSLPAQEQKVQGN